MFWLIFYTFLFVIKLPISLKLFSRDNIFNIIGAFDVPRYIYSVERKKFVP